MTVEARRSFERDIKKIKDQTVKQKIKTVLNTPDGLPTWIGGRFATLWLEEDRALG